MPGGVPSRIETGIGARSLMLERAPKEVTAMRR